MKTYSEKLRSPLWQRKKAEILQRDNFTCVICGSRDKSLQVHHIVYAKRDPWDYPDHMLQTLCCDCHEFRHERDNAIVSAIRIALSKVPNERLTKVAQRLCAEAMLEIEVAP